jgi:hypothetical protein
MVDGTLILQVLNFCIFWGCFYTLVFKPAYALHRHTYTEQEEHKKTCDALRCQLALLEESRSKIWYNLHMQYINYVPYSSSPMLLHTTRQAVTVETPKSHDVQIVAEQIKQCIVHSLRKAS